MKLLYALSARKLTAIALRDPRLGRIAQRGAGGLLLGVGGYVIATA